MVAVCRSREELRIALPHDRRRAVVMTMGALHAGHAALVDAARAECGDNGHVTVTIFVNPTQFGPGEDFNTYPRTPGDDIDLVTAHGCDTVFLPSVSDVYGPIGPQPHGVTVHPGILGEQLEGERRPGHFSGVLTVVLTLLQLTRADSAFFGEKDYQQLTLIRTMVRTFALPVRVTGVPTVRDADDLALSSRNAYLSPSQRAQARAIPEALFAARDAAAAGAGADVVEHTAAAVLAEAGIVADYLVLTDPDLGPTPNRGPARLLVAADVGGTRLLDNIALELKAVA